MSQSTNDVIPTAIKIAAYRLSEQLIETISHFKVAFARKETEFDDVIKMGRTHLQDAVPIRMGQEFGAYARVSCVISIESGMLRGLLIVNMGATAVGTGLNAKPEYVERVMFHLKGQVGFPLSSEHLVDATQNMDAYTELSASLKVCAVNLSKICNDIRLMASGPRVGLGELEVAA